MLSPAPYRAGHTHQTEIVTTHSTPDETESSSDAGGDRDDQHDDSDSDENTEEDSSSDDVMSLFDELENAIEQIRSLRNASISDRIRCFDRLVNVVRRLLEAGCGVSRETFNHLIIHGGGRQVQLNCWEVADVLDVHGMIIEQLRQRPALTSDPTNCAQHFTVTINSQSLNLQLSAGGSGCRTSQGVVYAILCVQCVRENTRNHEFYVGLTRRTVHQRVCTEHARGVANANSTGRTTTRHMYQHSAQHHGGSAFNHVFCVLTLPNVQTTNNGNQNLRKWEMFWQFLLHALEFRGGLGHR